METVSVKLERFVRAVRDEKIFRNCSHESEYVSDFRYGGLSGGYGNRCEKCGRRVYACNLRNNGKPYGSVYLTNEEFGKLL